MGGEGYALERALSDAALAQLRSREKRARSDLPRRSPRDVYEVSRRAVGDCMEKTRFNNSDAGMRSSSRVSQDSSSPWRIVCCTRLTEFTGDQHALETL